MRTHLRFLCTLLAVCLCFSFVPAALAADIPQAAQTFFADRLAQGYEITAWNAHPLCSRAYAVLSKNGENKLLILKEDGDSYRSEIITSKALYQGDLIPRLSYGTDDSVYVVYFLGAVECELYSYRRNDDGVWRLQMYRLTLEDGGRREFNTLYDDRMVYKYYPPDADNDSPSVVRNVYGVYQRALRYLNIRTLPRTLEEARETLSLPPEIPEGDFDAVTVQFRGGEKYEVYTAPDDTSLRAADGKAVVSTNDWIQVFGTEAGWALIQYEVSDIKNRIGYITQTALPGNTSVSELAFIPQEIEILRDAPVTDDPLEWQLGFTTVREGQAGCTYLATFNDIWVYIEGADSNGQRFRGFVEADAVRIVLPEDEK